MIKITVLQAHWLWKLACSLLASFCAFWAQLYPKSTYLGWSETNDRQKSNCPARQGHQRGDSLWCFDHFVQAQAINVQNQAFRILLTAKDTMTTPCLSQNDWLKYYSVGKALLRRFSSISGWQTFPTDQKNWEGYWNRNQILWDVEQNANWRLLTGQVWQKP